METGADPLGLVGTTIAEKYAVESVVGEGGFAIVYRAQHTLWKRPVAVKVFKVLGEGQVQAKDRQKLLDDFIREGALLADLSERSSAICQARDVGMLTAKSGQQVPYMVLEWLEGKPLDVVIEDERRLGLPLRSLEDTVHLLDAVAEALALAHKKGIAHRDVKPANVFVLGDARGDYSVKLLDFGIAKVVQDAQKMGFGKTAGQMTSFTPAYGAPEQFNRSYGSTGPWTDVFALALVATEILTGRDPLDGETLVQLAFAASDPEVRPSPRRRGALIVPAAEDIFVKALSVKPEDRYPTAGEFWNALRTVVLGHGLAIASSDTSRPRVDGEVSAAMDAFRNSTRSAFAATAPAPDAKSEPAAPEPPKKKKGTAPYTFIGIGALLAVGAGVAYGAHRRDTPKPPAASASAPAMVVASAMPAATCPAGMKPIPGGEFFMGSDEKDAEADEKPPHRVKLSAYCLDELEVTVAAYRECSNRGACLRAGKENEWSGITPKERDIYDPLCNSRDPEGKANHPVNCVDWNQAKQFCESKGARLPTEAEWEFAARGSDGRVYPWGDEPPSPKRLNACGTECVAWMKAHPDPNAQIAAMFDATDGFPNTAPVGSFPEGASWWGIKDIVGNVWEWVADSYALYDPGSASTEQVNPTGPAHGDGRIMRGGSWNAYKPSWVRPSYRFHVPETNRSYGTGFRCAKSM